MQSARSVDIDFRNDQPTLVRKREPKLGRLLADLCFGAHQKCGNVGDGAPVLEPVAKREQILFWTTLCRC